MFSLEMTLPPVDIENNIHENDTSTGSENVPDMLPFINIINQVADIMCTECCKFKGDAYTKCKDKFCINTDSTCDPEPWTQQSKR